MDQLNRDLLCDWLEFEGYEVWSSANLRDNFDVFARPIPDAVLRDIHLGAENGVDLLAWMHEKPDTRDSRDGPHSTRPRIVAEHNGS